jgi:hypothetical protein
MAESVDASTVSEKAVSAEVAMLNTKGFAEFLAQHPDADERVADSEKMKQSFEVFKVKDAVTLELKNLFSEQINKDFKIKLTPDDLESIDTHLSKEAVEHPDVLLKLEKQLKDFKELPKKIKDLETRFEALAGAEAGLEVFKRDQVIFEAAKKYRGGFLWRKRIRSWGAGSEARANARAGVEEFNPTSLKFADITRTSIREYIEDAEHKIARLGEIPAMRESSQKMFAELRKGLLQNIAEINGVTEAIHKRVNEELQGSIKDAKVSALDITQTRFEDLRSASRTSETGVDALGGLSEEEYQAQLDEEIEQGAKAEIKEIVDKSKLGVESFTKLEASLKSFIEREKIGSKEGEEAKYFIIHALRNAADGLGGSVEDKAKRILCLKIINDLDKVTSK